MRGGGWRKQWGRDDTALASPPPALSSLTFVIKDCLLGLSSSAHPPPPCCPPTTNGRSCGAAGVACRKIFESGELKRGKIRLLYPTKTFIDQSNPLLLLYVDLQAFHWSKAHRPVPHPTDPVPLCHCATPPPPPLLDTPLPPEFQHFNSNFRILINAVFCFQLALPHQFQWTFALSSAPPPTASFLLFALTVPVVLLQE